jgi:hypothetical protein
VREQVSRLERNRLYDELIRERFGPVGRLRRESPKRRRRDPVEDPAVVAQRIRDLSEATNGEA